MLVALVLLREVQDRMEEARNRNRDHDRDEEESTDSNLFMVD